MLIRITSQEIAVSPYAGNQNLKMNKVLSSLMHHLSVLIFVSSYILVKIVLKFAFNLRANLVATVPQTIQHFQFDLVNTATTMMICFPLKNVFEKL